jgi:ParB family chromosome partitioning protein
MTTRRYPSLKAASEDKDNAAITKSVTTFLADPREIVVEDGFNGRPINPVHVAKLKLARHNGAKMPPCVIEMVNNRMVMRDGHHRLYDVMEDIRDGIDIKGIQVIEFKGNDAQRIMLMIGSQGGLPMSPLELGVQYAKLRDGCGWTFKQIADGAGMSEQHVRDCVAFTQEANSDVQAAVARGEIKGTTARQLVKQHGDKAGEVIAAALVTAKMSGRDHVSLKHVATPPPAKGLTPRVLKTAGNSAVAELKARGLAAKLHLEAMLESPTLNPALKPPITLVLDAMAGRKNVAALVTPMETGLWWLKELAANTQASARTRAAAKWMHDNLYNGNFVKGTDAPAPSVLSLEDAIQMDMDSDGEIMAETMCAEHRAKIVYLRSGRK